MSSIINKIEQKLGDHPNASSNPDVNPESGTGKYANQGHGELISSFPEYLDKASGR